MKKMMVCLLSLALSLSLCIHAAASTTGQFTDVPDSQWYASAVQYATEHELFNGTTETTFSPNKSMTRAMFVTVLARMSGVTASAVLDNEQFTDNTFSSYYGPNVVWASNNGIVTGTSATKFSPDSNITREQAAVMLSRYFDAINVSVPDDPDAITSFNDAAKVSNYAKEAVEQMRTWGFITGDNKGNFNPQKNITRAETATVLMRVNYFLETGEKYNGTPSEQPDDAEVHACGVTANVKQVTMHGNETYQLAAFVTPAKAPQDITYTSSDTAIISVTDKGLVTGMNKGTAKVTITAGNGVSTDVSFTILEPIVPVEKIELDKTEATMKINESIGLTATVTPDNATDKIVFWSTSNDKIVSVDKSGTVIAKAAGTATVTAKCGDKTAACKITVISEQAATFSTTTPVINLTTSVYDNPEMYENNTPVAYLYFNDEDLGLRDARYRKELISWGYPYTFTSSDPDIIKVDEEGTLYNPRLMEPDEDPVTAYITVTKKNGGSITITVNIKHPDNLYAIDDEYIREFGHEVVRYVNEYRAAAGVSPLKYVDEAQEVAQIRANELVYFDFSHTRPDDGPDLIFTRDDGVRMGVGTENIQMRLTSESDGLISSSPSRMAKVAVDGWYGSHNHKVQMLLPVVDQSVVGIQSGNGKLCIVQFFMSDDDIVN